MFFFYNFSSANGIFRIYDYLECKMVKSIDEGHGQAVRAMDFHKTNPFIVIGGDCCQIKILHVANTY